jgi:hypothetical protein
LFPCLMGQVLVFILAPQLQIHPESLKQLQWCTLWFLKYWTHLSTV